MGDGDDVAPAMRIEHPMNGARDPLHHVDKALAAGRAFMRRRMPEAMERAAARLAQFLVGEALPIAKALLGEVGDCLGPGAGDRVGARQPGAQDCPRGLVRAAQIAGDPDRLARQLPGEAAEDRRIGAVAGHVLLAIDAALMRDRGMPHPPEPRRRHGLANATRADRAGTEGRGLALCRVARPRAHLAAAATSSITISPVCWKAPRTSPV